MPAPCSYKFNQKLRNWSVIPMDLLQWSAIAVQWIETYFRFPHRSTDNKFRPIPSFSRIQFHISFSLWTDSNFWWMKREFSEYLFSMYGKVILIFGHRRNMKKNWHVEYGRGNIEHSYQVVWKITKFIVDGFVTFFISQMIYIFITQLNGHREKGKCNRR